MISKKTKILMVGALSIQYVYDNWVKPVKELYDVTSIDVSPILSVYRNTNFVEKYIYRILREDDYQYMFFYSDAINPDFSDEFFEIVRKKEIPIITFLADDVPEIWYQQNLPYDRRFDLVATHSKEGYDRRKKEGIADNVIYLPWGYSDQLFKRISIKEKKYDVIYIGSNLCQEHDPSIYFGGGFRRQKVLSELYEFCKENNLVFKVFGTGWHRHPVLKKCDGGLLSNDDMVRAYNQSRIVFNPGFSADDNEDSSYQTKLRHFEVAGCGVFQLVNENPELAEIYPENQDIVYYKNLKDLKEKVLYYINHDKKRKEIEDNIYAKRKDHTTKSRLKKLFSEAENKCPTKAKQASCDQKNLKIKTYQTNNAKELLNKLINGTENIKDFDGIHIIPEDLKLFNNEYSLLKIKKTGSIPIMAFRSYIQLKSLYVNPIQRKKQNMLGIILKESLIKKEYHPWLLEYFRNNTEILENQTTMLLLMNLVIPINQIKPVAQTFLNKDFDGLKNLGIKESGLLISDYDMDRDDLPEDLITPPYILKLKELFSKINLNEEKILIYAAKGTMTDNVMKLISQYQDINLLGFVDKRMAGQKVFEYPVYAPEKIESTGASMIVIAAESSGFAIYNNIKHLETGLIIVPLHDLTDSVWDVLLP